MRQRKPQAMTFIEMLHVHIDPHINKHRKSESERKRKRKVAKQGTPEKVSWAIQNTTNSNHLCLSRGLKPLKQVQNLKIFIKPNQTLHILKASK